MPGATHRAPEGTPIDTVIDDLPSEAIEARFLNHRATIGATAIILTEYIGAFDLALDVTLATALLFALRRETLGFRVG